MAEIIFILITLYVAYVLHTVIKSKQTKKVDPARAEPQVKSVEIIRKKAEKKVIAIKKPKPKPAAVKSKMPDGSIRNPETGEVTKLASSYRMTRRWIKEALVSEGLLKKIYKTNEINETEQVKINKALAKLIAMKKYQ